MGGIYSFELEFNEEPFAASFSFIADGKPVKNVFCGISSRFAGDMVIGSQERAAFLNKLGINPCNVCGFKQTHSRRVLAVDSKTPVLADTQADGMISNDKNLILSVTVADCLPVYLFDAKTGAIALVHSGWKGTGIAVDAVNLMKERYGTKPSNIAAILGSCIGSCCYRVDKERYSLFEKEFGSESVHRRDGDFFLDLRAANQKLLLDAGLKDICVVKNCTVCDERLGSFRREGEGFTHMMAYMFTVL